MTKQMPQPLRVRLHISTPSHELFELEELLELACDDGWSAGDVDVRHGQRRVRKETFWAIEVLGDDIAEVESVAFELIRRSAKVSENIGKVADASVELAFWVNTPLDDTHFGLHLDKDTLSFVAKIGAEIDIDVY